MPYTLLTAAALGLDLVRRPNGQLIAELLQEALTADARLLQRLGTATDGRHPQSRPAVAGGGDWVGGGVALPMSQRVAEGPVAAVVRCGPDCGDRLVGHGVGRADALGQLVRDEILGQAHVPAMELDGAVRERVTRAIAHAVVTAWDVESPPAQAGTDGLDLVLAAVAAGPRNFPDLGPGGADVTAALATFLDRKHHIADRWSRGRARLSASGWADAMHEAYWAAHLSGRTRTVAAAHLLAVQIFRRAAILPAQCSGSLWNILAGFIQATAVADLLDDASLCTLTAPWCELIARTKPAAGRLSEREGPVGPVAR